MHTLPPSYQLHRNLSYKKCLIDHIELMSRNSPRSRRAIETLRLRFLFELIRYVYCYTVEVHVFYLYLVIETYVYLYLNKLLKLI